MMHIKLLVKLLKMLGLIDKKTGIYKLIQLDIGKLNLNKLNQKLELEKEDITQKKNFKLLN